MSAAADERDRALGGLERLWTPHRMQYVASAGEGAEETPGCPFCAMREPRDGDLVVHRGEHVLAVLNLHPYNPGHLMTMPFRHVADYEDLTPAETTELAEATQQALRVIRAVSHPHAFNVGMNLGGVAGGSLSEHLHQHVVPRWSGDANFITVVAGTKVLPQLLADTRDLLAEAWSAAG
ncbi:hypothetical protein GCM10011519_07200 [Marmoricola endophyticus]|uniref:HIT domain-containing protein n=1 Tax=Marmoricola endophyticus TaxID=2040280 RepID=A0A917BBP3_9ACTN|nr:HIT domain-containing protein [Marmoricola endophyticus]GGF36259.1 hypothetical protein GCM10011519_07200 [Marmoricola endophyticus]